MFFIVADGFGVAFKSADSFVNWFVFAYGLVNWFMADYFFVNGLISNFGTWFVATLVVFVIMMAMTMAAHYVVVGGV